MSDHAARWLFLAGCAVAKAALLTGLGIGVDLQSAQPVAELAVLLLFLGANLAVLARRWGWPLAAASDFCFSFVQLLALLMVLVPLSYLAAKTGAPLLDGELAALDARLGFDWDEAAAWVAARPMLDRFLQAVYFGLFAQTYAVLAIGSITRPGDRNSEAIWLFIVSALLTVAVFAFTPALGKVGHLGTRQIEVLAQIRSGGWTELTYERFVGIVNFPSFHTTLAILWTYTVRHRPWLLTVFAPLNLAVILSTPSVGGHYLMDLFGGAAVAVASVIIVRALRRRTATGGIRVAGPPAPLQTSPSLG